jgi:hypothetical protein
MRLSIGFVGLGLASALFGQNGLSAKYPGDVGMASDPDVLFTENFESGDLSQGNEIEGPVAVTGETARAGNLSVRSPGSPPASMT